MMLEPERAAALVAERVRRGAHAPAGAGSDTQGADWLVRRTLEELGVHCEATGALQDLKGFLIASQRGVDIVVSDRLDPDQRLAVYAHLLAHALLEEPEKSERVDGAALEGRTFFSRLEYVEGREPEDRSAAERRAELVADALASAMLRGRLDATPQYIYRRKREPARNAGLRPALGRLFIDICHRASVALFWHSPKYQKLRSRPEVTLLVRRLEDLMRVTYAC